MKYLLIITYIFLFYYQNLEAQPTFELEMDNDSLIRPLYALQESDTINIFCLGANKQKNNLRLVRLSYDGKVLNNQLLKVDDENSFTDLKKVIKTDTGFILVGIKQFFTDTLKHNLWVGIYSKSYFIKKEYELKLIEDNQYASSFDVILDKGKLIFVGISLKTQNLETTSYIGSLKIQSNTFEIKRYSGSNIFPYSSILKYKNDYLVAADVFVEIFDSLLMFQKKSAYLFPIVTNQGRLLALDSNNYLLSSRVNYDIGVSKFQYPFKKIKTYSFGKSDATELLGFNSSLDFLNKKAIFFAGMSKFAPNKEPFPTWLAIASIDEQLNEKWKYFYGGNANYTLLGILATSDGGCLLYGTKYYYDSDKKTTLYFLKLNKQGQLVSSDGAIQENSEVKIFPNPTHNIINISLAQQNELYNLQCVDSQGRIVYSCEVQGYYSFDVSQWQSGIYAFTIRDKKGNMVKTERVVVR